MNRIFSNKRLLVVAFFTVFSIAAAPAAMANDSTRVLPVELKYIGSINDQLILQLNFAGNAEENDFTINIKDEYNHTLYSENIKGENFYKKFLLNNDEIGDGSIRFEVISKRSRKTVVFEVNRQSRFVEEMVVSKVK